MKICVIFSSDDLDSPLYPELNFSTHDFHTKFIKTENAKEELDMICEGGDFDIYWSFLQDLDGLKYLESKNLPLIGTSSKFLSMTRLTMKRLLSVSGIKTPAWRLGSEKNLDGMTFPLIVRSASGNGRSSNSLCLCTNKEQVWKRVCGDDDALIEEYIDGDEMSMIVLETRTGVIALPLIVNDREMSFKVYDEDSVIVEKQNEIGAKAYEALGVLGSGYARINFRIHPNKDIYVVDVNPIRGFFTEAGDASLIESTFPGGLEAFISTIIEAKGRIDYIVSDFDLMAPDYDASFDEDIVNHIQPFINQYEFGGSVLDIGCGSGPVGRLIMAKHPGVKLTGMDISPKMSQLALAKGYSSVKVGLAENLIMEVSESDSFDHVMSYGMFPFVDHNNYNKILTRMFKVAKCSVSFTIEDITPEYNEKMGKGYPDLVSYNHMIDFQNFKVPNEWVMVHKKREFLWESPYTQINMYGLLIRFEKTLLDNNVA